MGELEEKILREMQRGFHCSQVMMRLSMEMRGIDDPFTIRALGALGGGMASQRACGTLTGGACVLSSYFPRGEGEPEPDGYKELVREFVNWFEGENGSLECGDLVENDRMTRLAFCPGLMAKSFEKIVEMLEDHNIDPSR
ncbi:MAG: C-GCAxxG-C-C family protein [Synergistaceae bacterium]|jgi:C_GCAxxG_C_C family probable redox protein|nr:C-GCAxxG-C-C family protein [Synergistaceae bacterium]